MKRPLVLAVLFLSGLTHLTSAQPFSGVSGVPGDGFPDFYYDTVAGIASFDSDGTDMIALMLSGPDPDPDGDNSLNDNCFICSGSAVFDPVSMTNMDFTAAYIGGAVHWIRTSPLGGPGLQGRFDLAQYEFGLTSADFPRMFDDAMGEYWQVIYVTELNTYFSNLTFVPEPDASICLAILLPLCCLFARQSTEPTRVEQRT